MPPHWLCSKLVTEFNGEVSHGVPPAPASKKDDTEGQIGVTNNNFVRSQGQNVGCVDFVSVTAAA
jgi:hypothetical protein